VPRTTEMEVKRLERALDAGHRWSFFNYEDAQCEFPERLVAEWLMEAVDAGADRPQSHGSARG
jgi:hypothetical protein